MDGESSRPDKSHLSEGHSAKLGGLLMSRMLECRECRDALERPFGSVFFFAVVRKAPRPEKAKTNSQQRPSINRKQSQAAN